MIVAAAASLVGWLYLYVFRGGFWRADQSLPATPLPPLAAWPAVIAVIPARNEAASIGAAMGSLLAQDYRGETDIVVVDDDSSDGTMAA